MMKRQVAIAGSLLVDLLASRALRRITGGMTAALVLIALSTAVAWAADLVRVSQKLRAFQTHEVSIAPGDTVVFENNDAFVHQIYVKSDIFNFDSDEQQPGQNINVRFTKPGDYEVRCQIHPKMLLLVHVVGVKAK